MNGERGYFFLPVICLLGIAFSTALLLTPSLDREDLLEARRLQREQARAAAEAAMALALHRGEDVTGLSLDRAIADARISENAGKVTVSAEARVPSLRDSLVTFEVTSRFSREPDGSFAPLAR